MDNRATVLFVDDEQGVLKALTRVFWDEEISVLTASSALEALDILAKNDVSVIVSDNLMPGMTGIEFLQKAKVLTPDTVRIMLTAHADVQSAIDAINKGEVFRYILKPWNDQELKDIVAGSIEGHRMLHAMKKADEYALRSLAQTIELKDPYTRGHCDRVAQYAVSIAEALDLDAAATKDIRHGSWLHDCGKIGIPEAILNFSGKLTGEQAGVMEKHPSWGAEVARLAHLSETVVNIIFHHHERYDGKGYPMGLAGDHIPIEARIVSVADMYDALTSDRPYRRRVGREKAKEMLLECRGNQLDPHVTDIFLQVLVDE